MTDLQWTTEVSFVSFCPFLVGDHEDSRDLPVRLRGKDLIRRPISVTVAEVLVSVVGLSGGRGGVVGPPKICWKLEIIVGAFVIGPPVSRKGTPRAGSFFRTPVRRP